MASFDNSPSGLAMMLDDIRAEVTYTREYIGKDTLDKRVMAAMARVPREEFVPPHERAASYGNHPLSIGHGQTISQPYIVALMSDLLQPQPEHVVLEIGTGSGYQAAILSLLVKQVYSIEIVAALAAAAGERLKRLHYDNVEVHQGDGYTGLAEHAPYDGIVVTAATPHVPPALLQQLAPGGRLVLPIGQPYAPQDLVVIEKSSEGELHRHDILPVAFVPLTGAVGG
jgi:protein-L-isoaspartate(D-aspartate) O-methyltransferase